ncbi:hypothetical protein J6590_013875 [Homalodisca vitripennis]|nr:hypothetical protein J6590_013875 [Homalodisca vitripennis]
MTGVPEQPAEDTRDGDCTTVPPDRARACRSTCSVRLGNKREFIERGLVVYRLFVESGQVKREGMNTLPRCRVRRRGPFLRFFCNYSSPGAAASPQSPQPIGEED